MPEQIKDEEVNVGKYILIQIITLDSPSSTFITIHPGTGLMKKIKNEIEKKKQQKIEIIKKIES